MAIDWKEMWVQTDKKLRETEMELFEVRYQNRIDTLIRETGNYLTTLEACEILDEEDRKARDAELVSRGIDPVEHAARLDDLCVLLGVPR